MIKIFLLCSIGPLVARQALFLIKSEEIKGPIVSSYQNIILVREAITLHKHII